MVDTTYLNEELLQTLCEDMCWREEVLQSRLTVFFRPSDRTSPSYPTHWRKNKEGVSYLAFIVTYGNHDARIPPILHEDVLSVHVYSRIAKKIKDISSDEYDKSYESIDSESSLISYLREKYPDENLSNESIVTVYEINYL